MKYDKKLKEKMLEEYTNTNITRKEITPLFLNLIANIQLKHFVK